jgi:type IV pilus assembly protein PilV
MQRIGRRWCGGFNLVEVLVALVVMSVGLLGIAGLYVTTLSSGTSAIIRMQAVNLAADVADRIRANRNRGLAFPTDVHNYDTAVATPANRNCAVAGAICTGQQLADEDLWSWRQQITTSLSAAAIGTVTRTGADAPYTYTINVSWSEPGQPALFHTLVVQL